MNSYLKIPVSEYSKLISSDLTNHYLEYIKGANDFEFNELLIISDLLKVSYYASEDHNSNVNMNSFRFLCYFYVQNIVIKFKVPSAPTFF